MFKTFKREDEPKVILDHFYVVALRRKLEEQPPPSDNNFLSKKLSKTVLKESLTWEPYVKESFPKRDINEKSKKEAQRIGIFCFPEDLDELAENFQNNTKNLISQQQYVFVFTDELGVQQFGFCRRIHNLDNDPTQLPVVLVTLTHFPWNHFHFKILEMLESRYRQSFSQVTDLVIAVLTQRLPNKGETLTLDELDGWSNLSNLEKARYRFTRPSDELQSDVDFKPLFDALRNSDILILFYALLLEQRILIFSSSLSKISSSIHALLFLLHPFFWQYVLVPILPRPLLEYCMAPMPFFIGAHSSSLAVLANMDIESVILVDLDNQAVKLPQATKPDVPEHFLKLKDTLEKIRIQYEKSRYLNNEQIMEAFHLWHLEIFGECYSGTFSTFDGESTNFDTEKFINSSKKGFRNFLRIFSQTQIFERFITERIGSMDQNLISNFFATTNTTSKFKQNLDSIQKTFNEAKNKISPKKDFSDWRSRFSLKKKPEQKIDLSHLHETEKTPKKTMSSLPVLSQPKTTPSESLSVSHLQTKSQEEIKRREKDNGNNQNNDNNNIEKKEENDTRLLSKSEDPLFSFEDEPKNNNNSNPHNNNSNPHNNSNQNALIDLEDCWNDDTIEITDPLAKLFEGDNNSNNNTSPAFDFSEIFGKAPTAPSQISDDLAKLFSSPTSDVDTPVRNIPLTQPTSDYNLQLPPLSPFSPVQQRKPPSNNDQNNNNNNPKSNYENNHFYSNPSHLTNSPQYLTNTPQFLTNTPQYSPPKHLTTTPQKYTPQKLTNTPQYITNCPQYTQNYTPQNTPQKLQNISQNTSQNISQNTPQNTPQKQTPSKEHDLLQKWSESLGLGSKSQPPQNNNSSNNNNEKKGVLSSWW